MQSTSTLVKTGIAKGISSDEVPLQKVCYLRSRNLKMLDKDQEKTSVMYQANESPYINDESCESGEHQ